MLRDAVESCLQQTVPVDVVVVDHGSSTETQRVCERFSQRVTVVRRERDSGPIFAWLDGVLHASTEFVNLHFDDDLKDPRFAEECLKLMRDDVGMVFSQARIIDASGHPTSSVLFQDWFAETAIYPSERLARHLRRTLVSPCAAVYRRQHMIDSLYVGRLPNQKHDYHGVGPDLMLQLLAQLMYPSVGFVTEELAFFRAHPGSITIDAAIAGKRSEFALAYDEPRLAVLDLRVARFMRRFHWQQTALLMQRGPTHIRKRLARIARRCGSSCRHAVARLLGRGSRAS